MRTSPLRDRPWIRIPRSMLAALFFSLFGLGGLLLGGLIFPILLLFGGSARIKRMMRQAVKATWWAFVAFARVTGLFRVTISAADRLRLASMRGCVIASNHLTLIDIVVIAYWLPDMTAIVKADAARNFFYSRIVNGVFLVNDDPLRVLREAKDLLAQGVNIVVFPEGTRSLPGGARRKLRRGAAQLALHAEVPVVPVFITCDPPVLGKKQPWYDVADRIITYHLEVREAIPSKRLTPEEDVSHAAAVALTEEIHDRLWPQEGRIDS